MSELAKNLEALTTTPITPFRPTLTIPSKLPPRTEPAAVQVEEPTYAEYIVAFLQETLALPEYGEVKAKLSIDRFGKLISCEILEARSKKNAEFLKNQLQDLTFPCFNESKTFTITFRNVD